MIYFVGIHHKPGLPALCSTTQSGRKIDAVIARLNEPCKKVNLFSTTYIPELMSKEYAVELRKFIDAIQDNSTLCLLGNDVRNHFPLHLFTKKKIRIVGFRHPAFSPSSFVDDIVLLLS
jgi:hypothetical protein